MILLLQSRVHSSLPTDSRISRDRIQVERRFAFLRKQVVDVFLPGRGLLGGRDRQIRAVYAERPHDALDRQARAVLADIPEESRV